MIKTLFLIIVVVLICLLVVISISNPSSAAYKTPIDTTMPKAKTPWADITLVKPEPINIYYLPQINNG